MLDIFNGRFYIGIFLLSFLQLSWCDPWLWQCRGEGDRAGCVKVRSNTNVGISYDRCKLVCGPYGSLFPRPKQAQLGTDVSLFLLPDITHEFQGCSPAVCTLLSQALQITIDTLQNYKPARLREQGGGFSGGSVDPKMKNVLHITIAVSQNNEFLTMDTDESYSLKVGILATDPNVIRVSIISPNFFGARHGLETFSQLMNYDEEKQSYQIINDATIDDSPAYQYRGVIVDTARNFIPLSLLKKTLDAMSYHKLNTFHWHITDSQSFPMFLNSLPQMASYGAYNQYDVYNPSDIRDLILYARVRGIRVLPEFDAPGHTGHGWQWGEETGLGKLVVCMDKQPWITYCAGPPCGQLNLANENMYSVLGTIYNEMVDIFQPIDLFHYGGDEVNLPCWNTSAEVVDWMIAKGNTLADDAYYKEWSAFQRRSRDMITAANRGVAVPGILWTSSLTEQGRAARYLSPDEYIIQIWSKLDDPIVKELLEKKFRVIFSNHDAFYLDCGVGSWVSNGNNWCPYSGWQKVYDNNFKTFSQSLTNSTQYDGQILGGEAAIWSEQIDESNLEMRLWPRGSALAERLWSDPSSDYSYAESRMLRNRERIKMRGVRADRLQPEWCAQNVGECRAS